MQNLTCFTVNKVWVYEICFFTFYTQSSFGNWSCKISQLQLTHFLLQSKYTSTRLNSGFKSNRLCVIYVVVCFPIVG